jgi:hypothetical protein
MIISIDAEKILLQNSTPLCDKSLIKFEIEGRCLEIIKAT